VGYDAVGDAGEGSRNRKGVAGEAPDGRADARGDNQNGRVGSPETRGPRIGGRRETAGPGAPARGRRLRRRKARGEERSREPERHCFAGARQSEANDSCGNESG